MSSDKEIQAISEKPSPFSPVGKQAPTTQSGSSGKTPIGFQNPDGWKPVGSKPGSLSVNQALADKYQATLGG